MKRRTSLIACMSAAAILLPAGGAFAAPPPSTPEYLADGLVTPLSLAVGPGKDVLVAQNFAGVLSQVGRDGGAATTVYGSPGWEVGGVATRGSTTFFLESVGAGMGDPDLLEGYLKSIDAKGTVRTIAELSSFEIANNPDGSVHYGFGADVSEECLAQVPEFPPASYNGIVDSHPYATAVVGDTAYVADAGTNTVTRVDVTSGAVSTLAVLPPRAAVITADAAESAGLPECTVGHEYAFEPVPTDVEMGPDGWLYVSSLPGGPEDPSLGARGAVFKVNPSTGVVQLWADNLLSPTGLAVAGTGDVYVASLFGNEIVKLAAGNAARSQLLAVEMPADVEVSGSTLYATAGALGSGKVLQLGIR